MASTGNLVSIKMVADRLLRNPIMKDLSYEFIVDNAIEVLRILDAPAIYSTIKESISVENYRALKPIQMMKLMGVARIDRGAIEPLTASNHIAQDFVSSGFNQPKRITNTYSLNSKYITVNFEKGTVDVIYKMIAMDEECYPMILDNPVLLRCVESYIKWKWFDIMNDIDIISDRKLNKAESDYMFNVAQADINLKMPSIDEMEALTNSITQILPSRNQFSERFEFLGEQEFLKIH